MPTGVMFAPVIPAINDHELEGVVAASGRGRRRNGGLPAVAAAGRGQGALL